MGDVDIGDVGVGPPASLEATGRRGQSTVTASTVLWQAATGIIMEVERASLTIEPEDLPPLSVPDLLAAESIRVDEAQNLVEIDGRKYHVPEASKDAMLDILE